MAGGNNHMGKSRSRGEWRREKAAARKQAKLARRKGGTQVVFELVTVFLDKATYDDGRREMEARGITTSQAEFYGAVLTASINQMRLQREAREKQGGTLITAATPEQVQKVLAGGQYVGQRSPRR